MAGIFGLLMSGAGVIKDQYYNLTSLLLPGNGTNGAQNNTFLDSSGNTFTITRNGNTTQGTFSPFSQTGWGNYFDGSGDYLTVPTSADFNLGTGAFTFETWVNPTASGAKGIFQGSSAGLIIQINASNKAVVRLYAVADLITSTDSIALNTWTHIAVARSGTTLSMWINGSRSAGGTVTDSSNFAQTGFVIGANETFANQFSGYMSNLRLVKGTAVYDPTLASISVPTTPLTAITNTSILTCQANRFVDSNTATTAKTITVNGNPSVTPFSPFAPTQSYSASAVGGSGYFDGTGDYLDTATNAAFSLASAAFTIEAWVYFNALGLRCIVTTYGGSTTGWSIQSNASNVITFNASGDGADITGTKTLTTGQWYHVAVSGTAGSSIKMFINGEQDGSTYTGNFVDSSASLLVGQIAGSNLFNGYISGLRVVKGTALYTTAFTPPTAPLTAITNTSLLLNFTNAGVVDATAKNVLETVGNAQISTTQSKWGGGSISFDGTGDCLLAPSSQNFSVGTGNVTIEAWIYCTSSSSYQGIISGRLDSAPNYPGLGLVIDAGKLTFTIMNVGSALADTANVPLNQWVHVAGVRSGSNAALFVNGTRKASSTSNSENGTTTGMAVGRYYPATDDYYFTGYIDDVRISKYARYDPTQTSITIPTAPFPVQ